MDISISCQNRLLIYTLGHLESLFKTVFFLVFVCVWGWAKLLYYIPPPTDLLIFFTNFTNRSFYFRICHSPWIYFLEDELPTSYSWLKGCGSEWISKIVITDCIWYLNQIDVPKSLEEYMTMKFCVQMFQLLPLGLLPGV